MRFVVGYSGVWKQEDEHEFEGEVLIEMTCGMDDWDQIIPAVAKHICNKHGEDREASDPLLYRIESMERLWNTMLPDGTIVNPEDRLQYDKIRTFDAHGFEPLKPPE